jgi:2-polyprenyl-3-methyl-5-hydroxy-6-metoxy-1,4-benzoquinol methylase
VKTTRQEYYDHQGDCRNIRTGRDVEAVLSMLAPAYDRAIGPWLPADRKAAIHEVACGPGILLRWLLEKGYTNLSACDLAKNEVDLARETGIDVHHGDAIANLENDHEKFTTIFALDFIEHITRDLALTFLRNSWQALQPGGRLILRMPNGDSPFVGRNLYNDITHEWAYTTISFRAVAKICGFSNVKFLDDTLVSLSRHRAIKLPLMYLSQAVLKFLFRAATHERFDYLGSSVYVCLEKGDTKRQP